MFLTPMSLFSFIQTALIGNMHKYKRQSLVALDTKDKPTTEKMETDLVSLTKRSLDQVTDALKRNRLVGWLFWV